MHIPFGQVCTPLLFWTQPVILDQCASRSLAFSLVSHHYQLCDEEIACYAAAGWAGIKRGP